MKRLALVILLPILMLYGCFRLTFPTYSWHQKLTLVVETPDGVRSGASVTRHIVRKQPTFGLADVGSISHSLRGEATVVDLGDGRYLFALLNGRKGLERAAFADRIPADQRLHFAVKQLDGAAPVPLPDAPLLVTFGDLSDPASVKRVDPADLAATFGAGYALREITLEVTDEPVTEGVVEGVFDYFTWPKEKRKDYREPL
ncbi:hypothetical protein [Profundibacter sp.]|uniref:hypothetical protein n=1 Tax=Profundibacter sp. TaxID=3101071 RepID=UPI003D10A569